MMETYGNNVWMENKFIFHRFNEKNIFYISKITEVIIERKNSKERKIWIKLTSIWK